jgi:hypothetical protein
VKTVANRGPVLLNGVSNDPPITDATPWTKCETPGCMRLARGRQCLKCVEQIVFMDQYLARPDNAKRQAQAFVARGQVWSARARTFFWLVGVMAIACILALALGPYLLDTMRLWKEMPQ